MTDTATLARWLDARAALKAQQNEIAERPLGAAAGSPCRPRQASHRPRVARLAAERRRD